MGGYESALARVQTLQALVDQHRTTSGPARASAAASDAFGQQLAAAMNQGAASSMAAGPDAGAAGGLGLDPHGHGPDAAHGHGHAHGLEQGHGAGAMGAMADSMGVYTGQAGNYALPMLNASPAAPYYGQPPNLLPPVYAQQPGMAPVMPGMGVPGVGLPGMGAAAPVATPMLTGKTQNVDPELLRRLNMVGEAIGQKLNIISGFRSREEQAALYQKYLNGTGNLAAPPGSSNHETGKAADVYINGVALANHPQAARIAKQVGLHWPVGGEPWHIEMSR